MIGVRHTGKDRSRESAFDAVLGSRAWTAAARAIVFFTRDPEHADRAGGLMFGRGNLAGGSAGRFRLDLVDVDLDDGNVGRVPLFVVEEGGVGISLDEALGPRDQVEARLASELFLMRVLAEGPVPVKDVYAMADQEGISRGSVERAKKKLGVVSERDGFGKGGTWSWRLP